MVLREERRGFDCAAGKRRSGCFFQAEDGIRDIGVTGVQTCALPIFRVSRPGPRLLGAARAVVDRLRAGAGAVGDAARSPTARTSAASSPRTAVRSIPVRSEERRVGKERRSRWWAYP